MMFALLTKASEDPVNPLSLINKNEAADGIWCNRDENCKLHNYPDKNKPDEHIYAFSNFLCPDHLQYALMYGGKEKH